MASYGKSIRLFFIEGESTGRWRCELSNWTGIAYKIPRNMLSKCTDRPDLQFTEIYMLIGKTEDDSTDKVYFGEAEKILSRINQHVVNSAKEWNEWNECVVFISKENSLNKAQVKYLENSIYALATDAGRCELSNGNCPTKSSLSEADTEEMEEFIFNLRLLTGAMGYRFLEPMISKVTECDSIEYYMKGKKGYNAHGRVVSDGFVVLKGSIASEGIAKSFKDTGYHKLREKLKLDGSIEGRVFTKDVLFSSYSAAASVVTGRSANGLIEWMTENGKTLKDELESNSE